MNKILWGTIVGVIALVNSDVIGAGKNQAPDINISSTTKSMAASDAASQSGAPSGVPSVEREEKGIDTIDLDQPEGNWLKKRMWWESAKDKYKEIRVLYEQIFNERMTFLEKRSELDRSIFSPFYRDMGIELGELREIIAMTIEYVEKERDESGFLNEKEREFVEKITSAKKELEQLKLDIDTISSIDTAIDKAISTLTNKINEAHRFEQSAWNEFDAIAQDLSDTRAMERYYAIEGIYKNLKELQKYIQNEFNGYFQGLVKAAGERTEKIKKEVKDLKDRDIDLKDKVRSMLVEEENVEDQEAALIAAQKRAADEAAKKAAQEAAQRGFLCRMWCALVGMLKALWNLVFGFWLYKF